MPSLRYNNMSDSCAAMAMPNMKHSFNGYRKHIMTVLATGGTRWAACLSMFVGSVTRPSSPENGYRT